eukprot:6139101-Pyramimonas_sp.AAC.1
MASANKIEYDRKKTRAQKNCQISRTEFSTEQKLSKTQSILCCQLVLGRAGITVSFQQELATGSSTSYFAGDLRGRFFTTRGAL